MTKFQILGPESLTVGGCGPETGGILGEGSGVKYRCSEFIVVYEKVFRCCFS